MFGLKRRRSVVVKWPIMFRGKHFGVGETIDGLDEKEWRQVAGNRHVVPVPGSTNPEPLPPLPSMAPVTTTPKVAVKLKSGCSIGGRCFAAGEVAQVSIEDLKLLDCSGRIVITDEIQRLLDGSRRKDPKAPGAEFVLPNFH